MPFIQGFLQQRLLKGQGWQKSVDSFPKHRRHTLEGSRSCRGWQEQHFPDSLCDPRCALTTAENVWHCRGQSSGWMTVRNSFPCWVIWIVSSLCKEKLVLVFFVLTQKKAKSRVVGCFWSTAQLPQCQSCPGLVPQGSPQRGARCGHRAGPAWPPPGVASCVHGSQSHPGAIISVPVTAAQTQGRQQKAGPAFGRKWPGSLQVFAAWPSKGWVRLQQVFKGQEHLCSLVPTSSFLRTAICLFWNKSC